MSLTKILPILDAPARLCGKCKHRKVLHPLRCEKRFWYRDDNGDLVIISRRVWNFFRPVHICLNRTSGCRSIMNDGTVCAQKCTIEHKGKACVVIPDLVLEMEEELQNARSSNLPGG